MDIIKAICPFTLAILTSCGSPAEAAAPPSSGAKPPLSSAVHQQIKRSNASYKACRLQALHMMKEGRLTRERLKSRLEGCNERFPGASLYINCKKNAMKSAAENKEELATQLTECKALTLASAFEPTEPLPFRIYEGKTFFAGVGVNNTLSLRDMDLPNFNCTSLAEMMEEPAKADYFFFGNHPRWFEGFAKWSPSKMAEAFKLKGDAAPAGGLLIPGLGKLFGTLAKTTSTLYLPSSSCSFAGDLGPVFTGLNSHYLLDTSHQALIPYATVAFYHPRFTGETSAELAERLASRLSQGHAKSYTVQAQSPTHSFITSEKLDTFDEDGEPRDLCRLPRAHKTVGTIKSRPGEPAYPEFILIANIEHLCHLGDEVSHSFAGP